MQAGLGDRVCFGMSVCDLHVVWFFGVARALDRIGARTGSGPFLRIGAGAIAVVLAAAGLLALRG